MRIKDPQKEEALFRATISLVNEIGFAAASVSKIAKAAQVSPATIYTYFKNKDDLLLSTYKTIMQRMANNYFVGIDGLGVKDALHVVWKNMYTYISQNRDEYLFAEQFFNSPYIQKIGLEEHKSFFAPLATLVRRGVHEKILKDQHFHMHMLFFYSPILSLANPQNCQTIPMKDEVVETAFQFAWDAIKI